jgi:glycosyltransferase involved in cell wall biosynthesis
MSDATENPIRVLVFFATNNLSGPGKGLFQLIGNTDDNIVNFTVCNFRHPKQDTFEFLEVAKQRGIDIRLITQRWALDTRMIDQALQIAKAGNYDLVQSHGYKTHILASRVARECNIPWVAMSHGWTSENIKIRLYNWIERMMLKFPDSVIGVAPDLFKEAMKIRKGKRSTLILNAIENRERSDRRSREEVRQSIGIEPDEFAIGVFGRLSFEKGQDLFIEALGQASEVDRVKAVMLGEGNARERLVSHAKRCGIENRVLFPGYRSNVNEFYGAIDLYVLPSRSEGLPNVVLEAQLSGCPVVAFDVGGVREVISDGETGFLVESGDVAALASRIDWAIGHKNDLQRVADAAYSGLFPKFSVESRCRKFVEEYRWLIRQHRDRETSQ